MILPVITTDQMREVDRLMVDVYGIELIQMMENAGRHLAALARQRFLAGDPGGKDVLVLAGRGGNGGGGLAAARRLHIWGARVQVFTPKPEASFRGVPAHQLRILKKMGIPVEQAGNISELPSADLILDALIGYGLSGSPKGTAAELIQLANQSGASILSLDVPSGLGASDGQVFDPHIQAAATLTLAFPKVGLVSIQECREASVEPPKGLRPAAQILDKVLFTSTMKSSIGELYLADISVPPELYAELGIEVGPIFAQDEILRL